MRRDPELNPGVRCTSGPHGNDGRKHPPGPLQGDARLQIPGGFDRESRAFDRLGPGPALGTTTRSRGRCSGNGVRPDRRRRVKPFTCVVPAAACSAASSSSVAFASSSSSWSSIWSRRRCLRSDRWPKSSRRSFSIISFMAAICASASDTFASAFAARASASVAFASASVALTSAAASAAFSASMSDPSGIPGSESRQPLRRHDNPVG